ncbi:hypothetical protein KY289_010504 [Solanum tuberosum]|nr:hypothetical protein KY289_010504 [Solanum tuberosum]
MIRSFDQRMFCIFQQYSSKLSLVLPIVKIIFTKLHQNRLFNHHSNNCRCMVIDHLVKGQVVKCILIIVTEIMRDNETNVDLYNDVNAEISDESSEEDEPPKDGDESEPDEDIDDIRDFSQNGVNLHNHKQGVSEIQNHDIPYFRTLENEEDIFMSICESEMEYCSVWSEEAKKDLKKGVQGGDIYQESMGCEICETEGLSSGHANLNTNLIASLFLNQIRKNPKYLVVDVISKVHEKFGHQVTYRKAWLGRQRAFELVYGDFEKSFSDLPKFFAAFQHFNHGTVVEWKHEESMSSLEPCIDGFQTCRPVISVDGTHIYGKYEIKLLIVVGIDGNDNILPLAFAIVDKESKEAWKWFFRNLSAHVVKSRQDVCVISYRAKGILTSLQELWRFQEPRAFHRFCIRHLKSNFQSKFPNKDLSRLMWRAASAHQVRKFESLMWQIREENVEAHEYLMEIPLDKWTVSHDGGKRWGVLTTNLSESFNGVLKKARGLPVTAMVRLSLEQTIERYTRRSQIAHQLAEQNELWTGRFKIKWEKNYERVYEVRSIQVDGAGGNPHCVSLNEGKCDCGKWVNLYFPCSHVMKAYWPSPSFTMRSNEFYRRPNRPRTTRIPNKMDRGSTVYERACGLCRQTEHDRRRCLNRN